jgi:hypothetical protein
LKTKREFAQLKDPPRIHSARACFTVEYSPRINAGTLFPPDLPVLDTSKNGYAEANRLDSKDEVDSSHPGNALKDDGDRGTALSTGAIQFDSKDAVADLVRGFSSYEQGGVGEPAKDFTELLLLDPAASSAYTGRGTAWTIQDNLDAVVKD